MGPMFTRKMHKMKVKKDWSDREKTSLLLDSAAAFTKLQGQEKHFYLFTQQTFFFNFHFIVVYNYSLFFMRLKPTSSLNPR